MDRIEIRLPETEKEIWKEIAEKEFRNVSSMIRTVMTKWINGEFEKSLNSGIELSDIKKIVDSSIDRMTVNLVKTLRSEKQPELSEEEVNQPSIDSAQDLDEVNFF